MQKENDNCFSYKVDTVKSYMLDIIERHDANVVFYKFRNSFYPSKNISMWYNYGRQL